MSSFKVKYTTQNKILMSCKLCDKDKLDMPCINDDGKEAKCLKEYFEKPYDKISEIYLDPELEVMFFRKGLMLGDSAERRDIYNTLLYLPPNNFRSMLIKALLLKFAGYSKESSTISLMTTFT